MLECCLPNVRYFPPKVIFHIIHHAPIKNVNYLLTMYNVSKLNTVLRIDQINI